MTFGTIDALRESLAAPARRERTPEYKAKMVHPVPNVPVVDRPNFIVARATGKVVLDIGASGPMHDAIVAVAKKTYGIDKPPANWVSSAVPTEGEIESGTDVKFGLDLDYKDGHLPDLEGVDLVVCGEVLEHLSNPGWLLDRLRLSYPNVPVIVTVPNAFSAVARRCLEREEAENVNVDHVAWYSWRTLKTLVERAGYKVTEHYWYGPGEPMLNEGLIFVLE